MFIKNILFLNFFQGTVFDFWIIYFLFVNFFKKKNYLLILVRVIIFEVKGKGKY